MFVPLVYAPLLPLRKCSENMMFVPSPPNSARFHSDDSSSSRLSPSSSKDKLERQGESEHEGRRVFLGGLGRPGPRGVRDVARLHDGCVGILLQVNEVLVGKSSRPTH